MRLTLEIVAKCLFDADVSGDSAEASAAMETLIRCFTARVDRWINLPDALSDAVQPPVPPRHGPARPDHLRDHRRAPGQRRGPWRPALDAAPRPGRGRRPADDRSPAPRRGDDPVHGRSRDDGEHPGLDLDAAGAEPRGRGQAARRARHAFSKAAPPPSPTCPAWSMPTGSSPRRFGVYPTVWLLGREAVEPCTIGGEHVPVGLTLWMSQWVLHRDRRFFDDPESFQPRPLGRGPGQADPSLRLLPVRRRTEDLYRQRLRADGGRPPAGHDRPPVPPPARPRHGRPAVPDDDATA